MYQELYPEINETPLQEIFGLKTSKKWYNTLRRNVYGYNERVEKAS
jgi:hypothetical protein